MQARTPSSDDKQDSSPGFDDSRAVVLRALADQSPTLIAIRGRGGEYLYANRAFAAALGIAAESLTGRPEEQVLSERGAPPALRVGAIDEHPEPSHRIDEAHLGLPVRRLLVSRFPLRAADDSVIATGLIATDLNPVATDAKSEESERRAAARHAELLRALEQMERLAYTDRLTGAWNRRHLEDAALLEMSRAERHGHPVSLLVLDVDHFKEINDHFGHAVGDYVLVELVRRLRSDVRRSDTITRWGGEEFIVLAVDTPLREAEQLAQKLCRRVAEAPLSSARHVTVSIGVAEYQCGEGFDSWFERADRAMFRAKADGRDRVVADPQSAFGDSQGKHVAAPLQLVWRKSYCCGNRDIDRQHRELFEHANRLLQALVMHAPHAQVLDAARLLLDDIAAHFAEEERLHRTIGYPGRDEHAAEHARLLGKAASLLDGAAGEALPIAEVFHFLAYEVVAQHLLGTDRHYFPYLEQQIDPTAP